MIKKLPAPTGPNSTIVFERGVFKRVQIDWENVKRRAARAARKHGILELEPSEIEALSLMHAAGRKL